MIYNQIQFLRAEAAKRKCETVGKILQEAADTIAELSAKLAAANKQLSTPSGWIPVEKRLPENDDYVLVSFANFPTPQIGRMEMDDDGGCAFYPGDEEFTFLSCDLYVNAWMPLPKQYEGE